MTYGVTLTVDKTANDEEIGLLHAPCNNMDDKKKAWAVYTSVDKTTNVKGHLIYCKVLEHTNHSTVARFGSDGLKVLWPRGVHEKKVLEFYSDAMVTNNDGLKEKLGNDFYNI
ncbi:unnamed protein product [Timema podura]|uniref:Uncharacterized protein n=1 Tax=Timema podura TaxID=61482 RepID=A0ABN7P3B6_TIMPD|nr:unnamed protein product [Timema podura]